MGPRRNRSATGNEKNGDRTLNTTTIARGVLASAAVAAGLLAGLQSPAHADTGNYCYRNNGAGLAQCNSYTWYHDIRADIHRAGVQVIWNGTDRDMCAGNWDRGTLYSIAKLPPGTEESGGHLKETDAIVDCRYFLQ